jgi:geranylgeranyl diphosphate synthase type II
MDDDDLRRGKPTCHKAFGEAIAILAGDGLLTLAFGLLAREPPQTASRLAAELARAAGAQGMIGGQALDIAEPPAARKEERLRMIHRLKTASLMECCMHMGAICAGAAQPQLLALGSYGLNLGLAFQITDDILDVTSTPQQLGKATRKDISHGKLTYPGVFGLDRAAREAHGCVRAAVHALDSFGPEADALRLLAEYIPGRKN